jgi:probable rRNA maturation factor
VDPDSNPPSRPRRFGATGPLRDAAGPPRSPGPGLVVTVSDGRGRTVRAPGLARWLAGVAPARARGELAIALVSDARIRALNRQYREQDHSTDVLSFPAIPGEPHTHALAPDIDRRTGLPAKAGSHKYSQRSDALSLGDIVIATGVAKRQARAAGHSYATELKVLALHGLLHLLGYDHERTGDRGTMARVEARLRRSGGLDRGLIERGTRNRPPAWRRRA